MKAEKIGGRKLKQTILQLLQSENFFDRGLGEIRRVPPRRAVNPLFSALHSIDERIKWRSVTTMGKVVADLAASDLESARVIMRRFIWNLNDESGGIGWGCPESMAEAMAQAEKLAAEYGCILVSYIQPEGNYLEHPVLQRGVLWGIGRLAHTRLQYARDAEIYLSPYLESDDPILRGLAVWAVTPLVTAEMLPRLNELTKDPNRLLLYRSRQLLRYSVGQLAEEALALYETTSI
jgi:hypothetical protein